MATPTASTKATICIHDGQQAPPLEMRLSDPVLELLQRVDVLQRLQAGEDVIPAGDGKQEAAIDRATAGEVEACLNGAVGEVLRCSWGRREVVRCLPWWESDRIDRDRAADAAEKRGGGRGEYGQHVAEEARKLEALCR